MNSKKICIFVNVDWFLLSHFTNYVKKCVSLKHSVTIITTNTGRFDELRALGAEVLEVDLHRGYRNIFSELKSLFGIYTAIRKCSPDVLEMITIKPVVYGGLIAKLLNLEKIVFYMSGLGAVFTDNKSLGGFGVKITSIVYKYIMRSEGAQIIVENDDDKQFMMQLAGKDSNNVHLVPGVGVNLNKFFPRNIDLNQKVRVAIASRLLRDKGVFEFFNAARLCLKEISEVEFLAVGDIDPTNPASLTKNDVEEIEAEKIVQMLGYRSDMEEFLRSVDVFVLPSYREGFPRAIMEAAATGLPVITTNVTGCRSAVIDGITGIIIPPKDSDALAREMKELISSPNLRSFLGKNARAHAEKMFDINALTIAHINVWDSK